VALTEAGRVFAEEARKVLAGLDFAVAEARRAGAPRSLLRIGCVPQVAIERLQRFIGAGRERNRDLRAQVTHALTMEQLPPPGLG
jgi:DNA-binding transcriptional LysR family regulator